MTEPDAALRDVPEAARTGLHKFQARLAQRVDGAGVAVFRMLFGVVMFGAVVRFVANGWIEQLYTAPSYHFSYFGFEWIRPWSPLGLHVHFAAMAVLALAVAAGFRARFSALGFFLLFTYVELLDKSAYLNHYYLVSLLSLLCAAVGTGRAWSVDAWLQGRRGATVDTTVSRGVYWSFRAQMAIVYTFAGLAKLNADWLLHAQPLRLWLQSFQDLPWVGAWLVQPWAAYAMSWSGALFDLTIPWLLLWKRTRAIAFVVALAFHVCVWAMFPIGVFPWVMLVAITTFFDPSWPRRWFRQREASPVVRATGTRPWPRAYVLVLSVYLLVQVLVPLRFLMYPGAVNWTEQGFRFAWRVMLIEKTGQVEYEVKADGRRFDVYPRRELTPLQYRMLSTQPDMIHDYAKHLARRFLDQGATDVEVYAHAYASLNGRPSQRLIDPNVDLAKQPDGFSSKPWIAALQTR